MIYICAGAASKQTNRGTENFIIPFMVHAGTRDEAMGKGLRVLLKLFPTTDGYNNHCVNPQLQSHPIDPDLPMNLVETTT